MRWTTSVRRTCSTVLHAPQICLRYLSMETASIIVSGMQLGTPNVYNVMCVCSNKKTYLFNVHQVTLNCKIS